MQQMALAAQQQFAQQQLGMHYSMQPALWVQQQLQMQQAAMLGAPGMLMSGFGAMNPCGLSMPQLMQPPFAGPFMPPRPAQVEQPPHASTPLPANT
eukprot:5828593-Pleurochrysis_carterae.AAC.4